MDGDDADGLEGAFEGLPPGTPFPFSGRRRRLPDEGELEVFVGDEQSDEPVDTSRWQRARRAGAAPRGHAGRGRAVDPVRRRDDDRRAEPAVHGQGRADRRARRSRSRTSWSSRAASPTRARPGRSIRARAATRPTRRCCSATSSSARPSPPATRPTHARAPTTTSSPSSSCTASCTSSATTTPTPTRRRPCRPRSGSSSPATTSPAMSSDRLAVLLAVVVVLFVLSIAARRGRDGADPDLASPKAPGARRDQGPSAGRILLPPRRAPGVAQPAAARRAGQPDRSSP